MTKHLLVAENYNKARYFARERGLYDWQYISHPDQLRGLEGPLRNQDSPLELHWVRTFYRRPDYAALREVAAAQGFRI